MKFLIIEDSLTICRFIERTLENHFQSEQIIAGTAKEGIRLASECLPDLVFLDFQLPDMRGDSVCEAFLADSQLSSIPVILISSNLQEIKELEQIYGNVHRSLAKPFSSEVLITATRRALETVSAKKGSPSLSFSNDNPSPNTDFTAVEKGLSLRVNTFFTNIERLLEYLYEEHATGLLQMKTHPVPISFYLAQGQPRIVTTHSSRFYAELTRFPTENLPAQQLERALSLQEQTAKPYIKTLCEEGVCSRAQAARVCQETSERLFSRLWVSPPFFCDFYPMKLIPDFALFQPAIRTNMTLFCLSTLRLVGKESLNAVAWGDGQGVPTFTRRGFDQLQYLTLTEKEAEFAEHVAKSTPLNVIAEQMNMTLEAVEEVLFVFLKMGYMEYWPSQVIQC